ncbi:PTS glucitol/sorbitol transporter subunit IIA [Dellaglioa sp. BT-FLS60]
MIKARIEEIGKDAISKKEPIVILFNQSATDDLRQVSVIQSFEAGQEITSPKTGDDMQIDDQTYKIDFAGELVDSNFKSVGHATLFFMATPEHPQPNGIYLTPHVLPDFKVGSTITYK